MADVSDSSVQFAGAGQPPNVHTPPTPGQQGAGEQPTEQGTQYMTPEDAQKLFEEMFERKAQSITTRAEYKTRKVIEAAQARGLTLTPEQAQAALEVVENEGQQTPAAAVPEPARPVPAKQPAPASTPAQQAEPELHPVLATAKNMMIQAGVTVESDDPELEMIDKVTTDPVVFLSTIKAAIEAKQKRLAMAGDAARIPSLGGAGRPGNPVTQIKDPSELWKLARGKGK